MRYKIVSCAAVDVTGRLQSVMLPQYELGHGDTQGLGAYKAYTACLCSSCLWQTVVLKQSPEPVALT